jgi:cytochrome c-type biogenesis protein
MNISLMAVSLMSGLFAGVSSCALPLYPILLGQLVNGRDDKRLTAFFFALGLAGTYFSVYLLAGTLSVFLGEGFMEDVEGIRGFLLLAGGLFAWLLAWKTFRGGMGFGVVRMLGGDMKAGYLGSLFSGFVYGTMVTPCNAPFLFTGIMPALASKTSVLDGALMLLAFSFAMALPLLLLGFASGAAMNAFAVLNKNRRKLELLSALFLAATGVYFIRLFALTQGYI